MATNEVFQGGVDAWKQLVEQQVAFLGTVRDGMNEFQAAGVEQLAKLMTTSLQFGASMATAARDGSVDAAHKVAAAVTPKA